MKRLTRALSSHVPSRPGLLLPARPVPHKRCLVLDLDLTMIHAQVVPSRSDNTQQFFRLSVRPGLKPFVSRMSELFELVIFTASLQYYCDAVLNTLYPDESHVIFPHRLYRPECTRTRANLPFVVKDASGNEVEKNRDVDVYLKDLSRLGRPLEETFIVDDNPLSYILQQPNGIPIAEFKGDPNDRELIESLPFFENLATTKDPIAHIATYESFMLPRRVARPKM